MNIQDIIDLVSASRECKVVQNTNGFADIAAFEETSNCSLPIDLRQFYLQFESVLLFDYYRVLPLRMVLEITSKVIQTGFLPSSWQIFIDSGDNGDQFLAIDLAPAKSRYNTVIDLEPDSDGRYWAFAKDFTRFATDVICLNGRPGFWIDGAESNIDKILYVPGSAWRRKHDKAFWDSLDETAGTSRCKQKDCELPNIVVSAFCKKHHYEQLEGPCPFVEEAIEYPGILYYNESHQGK